MRVIELSPTAMLAGLALFGLIFVALIGPLGALLFLAAGMGLIVRRPDLIGAELRHYGMICALPVFCAASVLWSVHPEISLRYAVQLGVTFAIAIAIANRVPPATFLRILIVLYALAAVASLGIGQIRVDGAWLGVFGSKNAFAAAMGVFVLLCLAVGLDPAQGGARRLLALAGLMLGALLLVLAKSAGALVITGLTATAAPVFYLAARLLPLQRVVLALLVLLLGALAMILLYALRDMIFAQFLDLTGKDVTLTGRTDLWNAAFLLIAERPLLGLGYQAFWVEGSAEAEELWAMFGIEARAGFNFHNTYISNAVEIGLIGVAIQAALIFGALGYALRCAVRAPSAVTVFFATFMLQLVLQSAVEVVAFFQFNLRSVIIVAVLIYCRNALRQPATAVPAAHAPARAA